MTQGTQEKYNNGRRSSAWSMTCVKCETNCDTYESKIDQTSPPPPPCPTDTDGGGGGGGEFLYHSTLGVDGRVVRGYFTQTEVCWTTWAGDRCAGITKVNTRNIIAINYDHGPPTKKNHGNNFNNNDNNNTNNDNNANNDTVELDSFPGEYFVLHFCKRVKNKWKPQAVLFHADDPQKCQSWVKGIRDIIKDFERPKKLLVFINPASGKKQAQKIYREKSAHYFDLAGIDVTTIMTERVNHARDHIEQEDLTSYDGIVCVGGDGLCSEIVNGMLKYEDESHQVKMTKTNTPIMLGIVPAGSTDTVSYCTSGTNDPVTATINIILGRQLSIDICSVWQDGEFIKYSMSLMGYGYFGDVIKESESLHWLGPKRYDLAGFKRFMINKSYEGEVKFIKADLNDNDKIACRSECVRCSTFLDDEKDDDDQHKKKENWQSTCGKFISVIGANMSCRCARSSTGISPTAHIGDGHIDLILIRKTTRAKYLQHLIKVTDKTHEQFDFNFIETHRVKEFSFTPMSGRLSDGDLDASIGDSNAAFSRSTSTQSDTSVWNVDGELVEHPSLHIKVHRHLITLFASGIEEL